MTFRGVLLVASLILLATVITGMVAVSGDPVGDWVEDVAP